MKSEPVVFCQLHERLLARLRGEMRAGLMTERRLAYFSGISQPHIHNILKGVRDLTPAMADRLLQALRWSILDFFETTELTCALSERARPVGEESEISVLARRIGPGMPWPAEESRFERLTVPSAVLLGVWKPVAARLAGDPAMAGVFETGDMVVLDYGALHERPDPGALFLVIQDGEGRVRWLRGARRGFYLLTAENVDRPYEWVHAGPGCVIEARLHLVSHLLSRGVPRRPPGRDRGPVRRSVAS